jgi:hypothetical protein
MKISGQCYSLLCGLLSYLLHQPLGSLNSFEESSRICIISHISILHYFLVLAGNYSMPCQWFSGFCIFKRRKWCGFVRWREYAVCNILTRKDVKN